MGAVMWLLRGQSILIVIPAAAAVYLAALVAVLVFREEDGVVKVRGTYAVPRDRLLIPGASLGLAIVHNLVTSAP